MNFSGLFNFLLVIVHSINTGSGTHQVNFMEIFCVNAGISC